MWPANAAMFAGHPLSWQQQVVVVVKEASIHSASKCVCLCVFVGRLRMNEQRESEDHSARVGVFSFSSRRAKKKRAKK